MSQALKEAVAQLVNAKDERFFPTAVKECRETVKEHFTIDGVITVPSP